MTTEQFTYTAEQVAARTNVSLRTVQRAINAGELPAVRWGKGFQVLAEDIGPWLRTLPKVESTRPSRVL